MGIVIFVIDFGNFLTVSAQLAVFEDIICRDYYENPRDGNSIGDDRCQVDAVQTELALVTGWQDAFATIPGIS
jgi:hypothetical protein